MRTAALIAALGGFAVLAVLDLKAGHVSTGVAALMLAVANGLLLS